MTNLAIDIGNTQLKIGVFQDEKLIFKKDQKTSSSLSVLKEVLRDYTFQNILVAATGNSEKVVTLLHKKVFPLKYWITQLAFHLKMDIKLQKHWELIVLRWWQRR